MTYQEQIEWHRALHGEPRFDDVLADPVVHRLMDRDGVSADDLLRLRPAEKPNGSTG